MKYVKCICTKSDSVQNMFGRYTIIEDELINVFARRI